MAFEITPDTIAEANAKAEADHQSAFDHLAERLSGRGVDVGALVGELAAFDIAAPSWALGTGGTRFGRFPEAGEPRNIEEKIDDVATLNRLTGANGQVSLHIPWDTPEDPAGLKAYAQSAGLGFAPINSNTFQDQPGQALSYKFGSFCHTDPAVRRLAVEHNLETIEIGRALGSDALTIWLADGSSFPGQQHLRKAFDRVLDCMREVYKVLPDGWRLFTEHKPFEPGFYSTVVQDWGSSLLLARELGEKAQCLVDLGHHLHGCNIEQVVARLIGEGKLAGFHFNDSKYADDDLTTGVMKPYQLFLIFLELVDGMKDPEANTGDLAWMIDQSHNLKDPLEDLLQSTEAILIALAQALLVDRAVLGEAQEANDVVQCQEILQDAFRTDVRPLVAEARKRAGAALRPIEVFRASGYRKQKADERGMARATGL